MGNRARFMPGGDLSESDIPHVALDSYAHMLGSNRFNPDPTYEEILSDIDTFMAKPFDPSSPQLADFLRSEAAPGSVLIAGSETPSLTPKIPYMGRAALILAIQNKALGSASDQEK